MSTRTALKRSAHLRTLIATGQAFCVYCGLFLHPTDCKCTPDCQRRGSYDHVIPKSLGGLNTQRNMVIACVGCNRKKSGSLPEEIFEKPEPKKFRAGKRNRHGIPILQSKSEKYFKEAEEETCEQG